VIYTTPTCWFCHAAKRLLQGKGVPFEEIDVVGRQDLRAWLVEVSRQRTVPQIFINGASIGGYTELAALETQGELDERLAEAPAADEVALRR
jgi:glutaredoxin 3